MRMEYLSALHDSGSATPRTGWTPQFMTLSHAGRLVGAAALYLKTHSWGEYVFDWAWADAYRRHGLAYYPKLLGAVPFTPATGSRLLAADSASRRALINAIRRHAQSLHLSSAHLLMLDDIERGACTGAGWMLREGVQFHWVQDLAQPAHNFEELLARLQRDKRKKIQQERRRVRDAAVSFTTHEADAISSDHWDFFYRCYVLTYAAHRATPYLTRDFFERMAGTMAANWLMFVAHREGQPIAASLIAIDRAARTAWGRYWGSTCFVPCLHFEACYYQPLQWCLANGIECFEGGAQGEHKMARGLMPVRTYSAHWLSNPRFADAVADFLKREGAGVDAYVDELHERSPFKSDTAESG